MIHLSDFPLEILLRVANFLSDGDILNLSDTFDSNQI